jgi:hypothetical protein
MANSNSHQLQFGIKKKYNLLKNIALSPVTM